MKKSITIIALLLISFSRIQAQTAKEILQELELRMQGKSSYVEMSIIVERPKWRKEMALKSWSMGDKLGVSVITSPAKEKGTVFLIRDKEVWNFLPSIDRKIKMPPSMMMQSWMGTDLTNDDLVKQSSMIEDYAQKIIGEEVKEGLNCWKLELVPFEDAPVVWGKIVIWIDQEHYMQLRVEFFDEDNYLVNTMIASDIRKFGDKTLPSTITVIPEDEDGNKTIISYDVWEFDIAIDEQMFTTNYMKRIK
ncbi:MAG: outer membrane lipoprotein-sorting protein [Planctomycetota bacterium]|jgi:outer membrane lipoprotein-sorting protein